MLYYVVQCNRWKYFSTMHGSGWPLGIQPDTTIMDPAGSGSRSDAPLMLTENPKPNPNINCSGHPVLTLSLTPSPIPNAFALNQLEMQGTIFCENNLNRNHKTIFVENS